MAIAVATTFALSRAQPQTDTRYHQFASGLVGKALPPIARLFPFVIYWVARVGTIAHTAPGCRINRLLGLLPMAIPAGKC
jgi:hypothetical protein